LLKNIIDVMMDGLLLVGIMKGNKNG